MLLEFGYGIIIYYTYIKLKQKRNRTINISKSGFFYFSILLGCMVMEFVYTNIHLDRAFLTGSIAGVIFLFALVYGDGFRLPASLILLGNASYFVYLTHPFSIRLVERICNHIWDYNILTTLISIVVALVIGILTYKYFTLLSNMIFISRRK